MVSLERLDEFVREKNLETIDILKVDTEGAEELVLKGAQKTLSRTTFLIIECAMDNIRGSTFSSLIKSLYSTKFNFHLLDLGNILHGPSGEILVIDLLLKNVKFTGKSKA